ncbi:hypothetical protein LX32DRAFT_330732 [Colletotrichum zoysiae]|uniref:Secreted protein n=1 Tax=Colletotrichum zoysiae TaxID=1216348 RepID=A0AAD9M285_9PEZI|nr:hypothetical protein LX32DRAFT_330732 [Colletotrichum zoysiae]
MTLLTLLVVDLLGNGLKAAHGVPPVVFVGFRVGGGPVRLEDDALEVSVTFQLEQFVGEGLESLLIAGVGAGWVVVHGVGWARCGCGAVRRWLGYGIGAVCVPWCSRCQTRRAAVEGGAVLQHGLVVGGGGVFRLRFSSRLFDMGASAEWKQVSASVSLRCAAPG